jgi:hypothetical protein
VSGGSWIQLKARSLGCKWYKGKARHCTVRILREVARIGTAELELQRGMSAVLYYTKTPSNCIMVHLFTLPCLACFSVPLMQCPVDASQTKHAPKRLAPSGYISRCNAPDRARHSGVITSPTALHARRLVAETRSSLLAYAPPTAAAIHQLSGR